MGRNSNKKVVPLHGTGMPPELNEGELAVVTSAGKETLLVGKRDGNAAEVSHAHFSILSQAEYDALENKEPNHIYYIK